MLSRLIFTYLSAAFQEKKIINDIANINIKNEKNTPFGVILQKRNFRCTPLSNFHQTKATNKNKVKQGCCCSSCLALSIFYIQRESSQSQLSLMKRKQRVLPIIVLKNHGSLKKDKSHRSRTRKTRNLVTPAKSCHSCQK